MQKNKLLVLGFCLLIVAIVSIAFIYINRQQQFEQLTTYFQYSNAELTSLKNTKPADKFDASDLAKWDEIAFDLVRKHLLGDIYAGEVYASLYTAQRDAAFISYNMNHYFAGNIDAVSRGVLCIYFAEDCANLPIQHNSDLYSNKIADVVLAKIKQRRDTTTERDKMLYPEKVGTGYWAGNKPYYGQAVGNWKPWLIKNISQFRLPPPPASDSEEEKNQLNQTRTALEHITDQQRLLVVSWAGGPGTITPLGIWLQYANQYMISHQIPLQKMLLVRSILAMGMVDAGIACFDTKYTYWAKRPFMLDKSIVSIMPTPNHPSYPSGHSSFSGAAETILNHYFPENKSQWASLAAEASNTRIWSGIHFPVDSSAGLQLGTKIGDAVIQLENANNVQ